MAVVILRFLTRYYYNSYMLPDPKLALTLEDLREKIPRLIFNCSFVCSQPDADDVRPGSERRGAAT